MNHLFSKDVQFSVPVRQRPHQNESSTEHVPLLGDSVFASYQSTSGQPSETTQQPGSSNVALIRGQSPAQTASVSQQTDSDQSRSSRSTRHGELTSGESVEPPSTISGGTHGTSDSLSSINPACAV